jgi:hypothetical protein
VLPAGPVRWVVLTADGTSIGASASAKQAWLAALPPDAEVAAHHGVIVVRLPRPETVRLPDR